MSECVDTVCLDLPCSVLQPAGSLDGAWFEASRQWFIELVRAQLQGQTGMPYALGLNISLYQRLLHNLASSELQAAEQQWFTDEMTASRERAAVYAEMLGFKAAEQAELVQLLKSHAAVDDGDVHLMAIIVASASLAPAHLWQSLGLASRSDLAELLAHFFPTLVAQNTHNMRWKRFFYRCLCEQGGDYVCRAPSCAECSSYQECFAPE